MSFGVSGACSAGLQPTRSADGSGVYPCSTEPRRQRPSGDGKFSHLTIIAVFTQKEGAPHYRETQGDRTDRDCSSHPKNGLQACFI